MTYRLMAEWATMPSAASWATRAPVPLPTRRCWLTGTGRSHAAQSDLPARSVRGSAVYRHGDRTPAWLSEGACTAAWYVSAKR